MNDGDRLEVTDSEIRTYLLEHPDAAGLDVELLLAPAKARAARPDLTDADFADLIDVVGLPPFGSGHTVADILRRLAAFRPPPTPPGRGGRPRLTEEGARQDLRRALRALAAEGITGPTQAQIAEACNGKDPRTIGRWLSRFPSLRTLLPSSGRFDRT